MVTNATIHFRLQALTQFIQGSVRALDTYSYEERDEHWVRSVQVVVDLFERALVELRRATDEALADHQSPILVPGDPNDLPF